MIYTRADLISESYLDEQRALHAAPRGYGGRGAKWGKVVADIAREFSCASILDYGCGEGSLSRALAVVGLAVADYDPAVAGKDTLPEPADLVVCTDVLEHVESDRIYAVAGHLASLTRRALFTVISLVPTAKRLSDGRQAHILLRSVPWWRTLLEAHDVTLERELPVPEKAGKEWVAVWGRR